MNPSNSSPLPLPAAPIRRIGLLGGTFDPIHEGHLTLAEAARKQLQLDEVWLVVSPQNPFKAADELTDERHRLALVQSAVANRPGLVASDVEFALPRPSYTASTLRHLLQKHPDCGFVLIIGADNWAGLNRWKEADWLWAHLPVAVYPRSGDAEAPGTVPAHVLTGPPVDLSSTEVRAALRRGEVPTIPLPEGVWAYLQAHGLYALNGPDSGK